MNPEDCLKAVEQLETDKRDRPLIVAAAHWGTFKLTDEPMDEPPERMRSLWQGAGRDRGKLWIMQHGETRRL